MITKITEFFVSDKAKKVGIALVIKRRFQRSQSQKDRLILLFTNCGLALKYNCNTYALKIRYLNH